MPNLRLLQIIGAPVIKGNFKNLFPQLRCIRWHSCPWTHIPSAFRPRNLVSIDMPSSKFKILWRGPPLVKPLNNLCCLNLSECRGLKRLPDQLSDMKALKTIDVSSSAIEKLPDSITQLKELFSLDLRFCTKLKKIPEQIGNMEGLRKFNACLTAIEQLPDSFVGLINLEFLNLSGCSKLQRLPEQLGEMQCLEELYASYTAIEEVPDSIGLLSRLRVLGLNDCEKLKKIPEQIGNMEGLRIFYAFGTAIEQLPDSFVGLINLELLGLDECSKLQRLPEQLGEMQCLKLLYARHTAIEEVPDSIGLLSRLQLLDLNGCEKVKYVPESIWNLTSIQSLYLYSGDIGIISLPDSVEKLNKLTTLNLSCNVRLCLPMILRFPSLKDLTLTDEGESFSSAEPVSLSQLFNLRELSLNKCTSLGSSLPELPLNLKKLSIYDHYSLEQLPDLSSLKLLEELIILSCDSLSSISILPSHLRSLSVHDCKSLQDLPDLSVLKKLAELDVTRCNNLKSISLKESSLQVYIHSHSYFMSQVPFKAHLPNREVAQWFSYKSSGHTITFDIPPSFGSKFLGLALWVVYTCKPTNEYLPYIKAVITNNTESITENYPIRVLTAEVGEAQSRVECITGEKMRMKSGDKIKVSIRSSMYSDYTLQVPVAKVKVMMCGVHMIQQDRLSTSVY